MERRGRFVWFRYLTRVLYNAHWLHIRDIRTMTTSMKSSLLQTCLYLLSLKQSLIMKDIKPFFNTLHLYSLNT